MSLSNFLEEKKQALQSQIKRIKSLENQISKLEAEKKSLFSKLHLELSLNGVQFPKYEIYSNQKWLDFALKIAGLTADLSFETRQYEIMKMTFNAEMMAFKREAEVIGKQGA